MIPPHFCHWNQRQVEKWCMCRTKMTYVWQKDRLIMSIKAMEKGNMINTKAMMNKITQDQGDNPYKRVVLNNVYKLPENCSEMKNWSIFSDNIRYIQHWQNNSPKSELWHSRLQKPQRTYIYNWKKRKERL